MKEILEYELEELKAFVAPAFRTKQIYEWVYQKYINSFEEITSLPKEMRARLAHDFSLSPLREIACEQSKDGCKKYLFALRDGHTVESVLLPMKEEQRDNEGNIIKQARFSICISSQVGCKSACSFCYTAKGGFVRNLSTAEIIGQVLYIKKANALSYERRTNIVFMGMGEPLDNLANVAKAVRIMSTNEGLGISPRRQTISTSGLAKQIKELGKLNLGVLLAISLHAVDDTLRSKLMPINKAYNIASVMEAVRGFPIDLRKRVMFEYLLIKGINDDLSHAKELVRLLEGIKSKVNLIYFNPHEGSTYKRPSIEAAQSFCEYLNKKGVTATIRQSKGLDISAACGQLKEKHNDAS